MPETEIKKASSVVIEDWGEKSDKNKNPYFELKLLGKTFRWFTIGHQNLIDMGRSINKGDTVDVEYSESEGKGQTGQSITFRNIEKLEKVKKSAEVKKETLSETEKEFPSTDRRIVRQNSMTQATSIISTGISSGMLKDTDIEKGGGLLPMLESVAERVEKWVYRPVK